MTPKKPRSPRVWWLVVDCDGMPLYAHHLRELAREDAADMNRSSASFKPYRIIRVVEQPAKAKKAAKRT